MPKQTFFNLPPQKRERILQTGMEEFAAYPYLKSSTNRIIENADISKGSFYQYFDNKKDLYKYIISKATDEKIEFLNQQLPAFEKQSFFEYLRALFIGGIKFKQEYPLLSKIGDRLLTGDNETLKKEIYAESRPKSNLFFLNILKKAEQRGELDPEVDIEMTAFMLTDFSISIIDYYFQKYGPENTNQAGEDLEQILDYVDKMIYIMKNGIAKGC
ncbi:TetR/AcrR family transcriptional regulator [Halanaerobium sp. Z-7514]|uniref:TetR/AcrR family transcriptional regulator n=1 Tax=Halanaerobium polyolivorans TaxID=2886943 RepID=A0AAW4WZ82_9FIRM|nr:TetR/AcrR family transcriptional regulator [Halanaerobium polyolivorans]